MGLFDKRSGSGSSQQQPMTPGVLGVKLAMRKLWSDHVVWTRQYIIGAVAGTPDAGNAADRLMRNQEDIGEAIVPYFGRDAGNKLTTLLKEHIGIAVKLVDAARTNNTDEFKAQDQKWTQNADEIATFLSSANSFWPREDVQSLLHLHLKLTKDEATARIKKDYAADVKAFDDIYSEAMTIADALADGLVKKFPDKFRA